MIIMAILAAIAFTSFLSGIFGMAGGLILMGVLLAVLPLAVAMVWHGAVQALANGWRAFLLRSHICWDIVWRYAPGAIGGAGLALFIGWKPDKTLVLLLLGITAFAVWLPANARLMGIEQRGRAEICGFLVQILHITAGVAGPIFDMFFVGANMTRQQIVATKSIIQTLSHCLKIVVWGSIALPIMEWSGQMSLAALAAIPLCMIGTWLGSKVLHRMSERVFRQCLRLLISAIGVVFLARALMA